MQNRLDELFQAARSEQPFYTYNDAEKLIASFPEGGFSIPKVPAIILGTVLITGAALFFLQDSVTKTPDSILTDPQFEHQTNYTVTDTVMKTEVHHPEIPGVVNWPAEGPIDSLSDSQFHFGGTAGNTPQYSEIEKKKTKEEYITLNNKQLAELGIILKEDKALHYDLNKRRRPNLFMLEVETRGYFHDRQLMIGDTLREKDILYNPPFAALFIEIKHNHEYLGERFTEKPTIIFSKRDLIGTDNSIPYQHRETAFQHLKDRLIPVAAKLNTGKENGDITIIFYFPPTPQLMDKLPGDIDRKWHKVEEFSWQEYVDYRKMMYEREQAFMDDVKKRTAANTRRVSQTKPTIDKELLMKLGIYYDGKGVRIRWADTTQGFIQCFDNRINVCSEEFLYCDTNRKLPYCKAMLITDSIFSYLDIINTIVPFNIFENRELRIAHCISVADTLVPVLVPLNMTAKEKLTNTIKPGRHKLTHLVFWFRRADLEMAGFKVD